ncbi:MAG: squalene--hopene cyclase [Planctomycetes bacterium]|nr:squalene--hopene cyclase [Planctomycetota bacterium]
MPVLDDRLDDGGGRAAPARGAAARIEEWVRRSPPITVSLSLHVIVLLSLALWFVRVRREDRVALDVSFLSTEVVESPVHGVLIEPEREPVREPDPEEVPSEKPPIEDPNAAPPVVTEPTEDPGAVVIEATAPAIGTLLDGREEGRRAALVDAFGGSTETEAAVAKSLLWLARQQDKKDGLWGLQGPYRDGGSQENRLAATAMVLLAFQGAGNTTSEGPYKKLVERAWKALVNAQLADGRFDVHPPLPTHHALYSHAQATIAACELYGMTRSPEHEKPALKALDYAVAAQGPNGGWRYEPGHMGDMSVTGWYMMALKSGQMAGLPVPEESLIGIGGFLDTVAVNDGVRYGYRVDVANRPASPVTAAISAEGLLCRQYLGWRRDEPRLVAGIETLIGPPAMDWDNDKDVYAWYYITQVAHHVGGDAWRRWNDRMKEVLPAMQVKKGPEAGSWDPSLDKWGHIGGRLFTTCFCTYMLEVYYRHLPLYAAEAVAQER